MHRNINRISRGPKTVATYAQFALGILQTGISQRDELLLLICMEIPTRTLANTAAPCKSVDAQSAAYIRGELEHVSSNKIDV
jgi:hypothetical protein